MARTARFIARTLSLVLLVGPWATGVGAQEESILNIHGFGGWAAGYTNNDNFYPDVPAPIASNDFEVDNYYFTLNLVARPADKVVIHAQPTWESNMHVKRMQLDLAYVELSVVEDLRLRAGRIKNPLGLYTTIFKVGTLRPFYLPPTVYYRAAPEGYAGLGINRIQSLGSWELELDLLGGQMTFESTDFDMIVGLDPVAMQPVYASLPAVLRGRDIVAGGALLRLPVKGLQLGASAYSMKLYASVAGQEMTLLSDDRQKAYAGSIEYLTDKISLRSEALLLRGYNKSDSWYVEAAYHLTSHWQVAGTYQMADFKEPTPIVASLSKDQTMGVALNYWLNPKLVWKLNYYRVSDNRAARRSDAINHALAGTLDKDTDVLVGGVHFSF
ncbi:MAG: hypothetical protein JXO72_11945 [Vicinamibacteria bacterium]|nr:hypothetical protein [Vicinamibacteria bacterium]